MKCLNVFTALVAVFTLFFLFDSATFAAVYKWVDKNGQTVYSQNPPPGDVEFEEIGAPPKVDSARALKKLRDDKIKADKMRRERLREEADQKKTREQEKEVKKNCKIAKGKLASLQRPRAKILQPDGSRIRLPEEERQRQIKEAEAKIKEWCED